MYRSHSVFLLLRLNPGLQELEESCEAQRREFEALLDNAQQIAMATGDNRTASYAGQLLSRFQTLTGALKVK